jgi:hypothetical protein
MKARVRLFNFLFPGVDSQRGQFRLDEIWEGILKVEPPGTSLIPEEKEINRVRLSADVAEATRLRLMEMTWRSCLQPFSALPFHGSRTFQFRSRCLAWFG